VKAGDWLQSERTVREQPFAFTPVSRKPLIRLGSPLGIEFATEISYERGLRGFPRPAAADRGAIRGARRAMAAGGPRGLGHRDPPPRPGAGLSRRQERALRAGQAGEDARREPGRVTTARRGRPGPGAPLQLFQSGRSRATRPCRWSWIVASSNPPP